MFNKPKIKSQTNSDLSVARKASHRLENINNLAVNPAVGGNPVKATRAMVSPAPAQTNLFPRPDYVAIDVSPLLMGLINRINFVL